MTHRRRRISRILLAVLAVVILAGVIIYARKPDSSQANQTGTATSQPSPTTSPAADGAPTTQVATSTPTTTQQPQPQTQPGSAESPATLITQTPTVPSTSPGSGFGTEAPAVLASATPASQPIVPAMMAAAPAQNPPKVTVQPPPASSSGATTPAGNNPIAHASALLSNGKFLEARDAANAPLVSGRLSPADAAAARQLLSEINKTVVFSTRKFAEDKFGGTYKVAPGDRLDRIGAKYGVTPALLLDLNGLSDARRLRADSWIKVVKGPFHAVVSKRDFRLDLYLNAPGGPDAVYVTSYPVGLGAEDSTPAGKWLVERDRKVKNPVYYSPRGEGVIEADDPRNPLGDYWIGLTGLEGAAVGKESYGIHGTIEPDSIGKQASMGCVRLRNEDVAVVFQSLAEGKSTVVITE